MRRIKESLLLLFCAFVATEANPDGLSYLAQFGYIEPGKEGDMVDATAALKDFQEFFGLPQTGKFDDATAKQMAVPRCGLPDKTPVVTEARKKRGMYHRKWSKQELTYFLASYPTSLGLDPTYNSITEAFNKWEALSNLRFRKVGREDEADLIFRFIGSGQSHGDRCSTTFGPTVIAHAAFPVGGYIHYNMKSGWDSVKKLVDNSIHEIGHAIGLTHSNDQNSIMFPSYDGSGRQVITQQDSNDIAQLYGRGGGGRPAPPRHNPPPPPPPAPPRRGVYKGGYNAGLEKARNDPNCQVTETEYSFSWKCNWSG